MRDLAGCSPDRTACSPWASCGRRSIAPALSLFQAAIQRHVSPWLWEAVILRILLAPAWLVLIVPGAALAYFFRAGSYRRSSRLR